MSIAGLATYQNRSMYYSVRNGSGNYDFGNGGSFMNQMLAFHREDIPLMSSVSLWMLRMQRRAPMLPNSRTRILKWQTTS